MSSSGLTNRVTIASFVSESTSYWVYASMAIDFVHSIAYVSSDDEGIYSIPLSLVNAQFNSSTVIFTYHQGLVGISSLALSSDSTKLYFASGRTPPIIGSLTVAAGVLSPSNQNATIIFTDSNIVNTDLMILLAANTSNLNAGQSIMYAIEGAEFTGASYQQRIYSLNYLDPTPNRTLVYSSTAYAFAGPVAISPDQTTLYIPGWTQGLTAMLIQMPAGPICSNDTTPPITVTSSTSTSNSAIASHSGSTLPSISSSGIGISSCTPAPAFGLGVVRTVVPRPAADEATGVCLTSDGSVAYFTGEAGHIYMVQLNNASGPSTTVPLTVTGSRFRACQLSPDDSILYVLDSGVPTHSHSQ